jgi:hypothetical protein
MVGCLQWLILCRNHLRLIHIRRARLLSPHGHARKISHRELRVRSTHPHRCVGSRNRNRRLLRNRGQLRLLRDFVRLDIRRRHCILDGSQVVLQNDVAVEQGDRPRVGCVISQTGRGQRHDSRRGNEREQKDMSS